MNLKKKKKNIPLYIRGVRQFKCVQVCTVLPQCSLTFRPSHEMLDVYRHAPPSCKEESVVCIYCMFSECCSQLLCCLIGLPCVCATERIYWCWCSVCRKVFSEVAFLFLSVSKSLFDLCVQWWGGAWYVPLKPRPPHLVVLTTIYIYILLWKLTRLKQFSIHLYNNVVQQNKTKKFVKFTNV